MYLHRRVFIMAVIRYLYLKVKTDKEIHDELADVYGFLLRLLTVDETGFIIISQRIKLRVVSG